MKEQPPLVASVHVSLKAETPNKYRYTPTHVEGQAQVGDIYIWKGCFPPGPAPHNLLLSIRMA